MTRGQHQKRPAWLNNAPTDDQKGLARTRAGSFLTQWFKKYYSFSSAMEMLPHFCEYLGRKDPKFAGLKREELVTTDKTTYAVYDILRKQIELRKNKNKVVESKPVDMASRGHTDPVIDWQFNKAELPQQTPQLERRKQPVREPAIPKAATPPPQPKSKLETERSPSIQFPESIQKEEPIMISFHAEKFEAIKKKIHA